MFRLRRITPWVIVFPVILKTIAGELWFDYYFQLQFLYQSIHSLRQFHFYSALQVRYYSEALPTQHGYWPEFDAEAPQATVDLPKFPARRLERDSGPRLSGQKASTLPMRHHVPLKCSYIKQ